MQSYYIKARELRDKLASSVRSGGGGCAAGTLARANCLAVDEIGRCVFDKERAELLFHIVDRRCEREDPNTTTPASNFGADRWGEFFTGARRFCALSTASSTTRRCSWRGDQASAVRA